MSAKMWLIGKKLPDIYKTYFGRPLSVSKRNQRPFTYGPGVRFIKEVLVALGIEKTPDAIEIDLRRYRTQWDKSPQK